MGGDYDFCVFTDPIELRNKNEALNLTNNKSRTVTGYCWEWSKANRGKSDMRDVLIEEEDFGISWNLDSREAWAIDENSVAEAGCIHTAQRLEFDYVGVIIGDDMRYENGKVVTDYTKRAKTDQSLKGIKTMAKENPERAQELANQIIRNTYRTLMTRDQKGCYVYCTDAALG